MSMLLNDVQLVKAPSSIDTAFYGRITEDRLVQPENIPPGTADSPLPRDASRSLVHPENAESPMLDTESGMST